jgi:hypothetical protein
VKEIRFKTTFTLPGSEHVISQNVPSLTKHRLRNRDGPSVFCHQTPNERSSHVGCYAMSFGEYLRTFRKIVMSSLSV